MKARCIEPLPQHHFAAGVKEAAVADFGLLRGKGLAGSKGGCEDDRGLRLAVDVVLQQDAVAAVRAGRPELCGDAHVGGSRDTIVQNLHRRAADLYACGSCDGVCGGGGEYGGGIVVVVV